MTDEQKNSAEETPNTQAPEGETKPTEDYAGYNSLEDMRNAIYESRKEGKRLAEHNAALAAHILKTTQASSAAEREPADELSDLGIPVAALERVVERVATKVMQKEMAPASRTQEAIASVRATHPTFAKSEPDFNRWLGANPDVVATYNQAVAESPRSAEMLLKGVFAEYEATRRPAPPADPKRVGSDSQIPAKGGGPTVRKEPADKPSREEMQALIKEARRTGDRTAIMRQILGNRPIHRDLAKKDN